MVTLERRKSTNEWITIKLRPLCCEFFVVDSSQQQQQQRIKTPFFPIIDATTFTYEDVLTQVEFNYSSI